MTISDCKVVPAKINANDLQKQITDLIHDGWEDFQFFNATGLLVCFKKQL